MGYTMAVPIKSRKMQARMMAFLDAHFLEELPFKHDMIGDLVPIYPTTEEDLAYDDGKCRIGFNFSLSSAYVYAVCQWIALRVGRRRRSFSCDSIAETFRLDQPVPYIVYDGEAAYPLLPLADKPHTDCSPGKLGWFAIFVDEHGCPEKSGELRMVERAIARDAGCLGGKPSGKPAPTGTVAVSIPDALRLLLYNGLAVPGLIMMRQEAKALRALDDTIKAEMQRLSVLWSSENPSR
jgi:hypothetical protein